MIQERSSEEKSEPEEENQMLTFLLSAIVSPFLFSF